MKKRKGSRFYGESSVGCPGRTGGAVVDLCSLRLGRVAAFLDVERKSVYDHVRDCCGTRGSQPRQLSE